MDHRLSLLFALSLLTLAACQNKGGLVVDSDGDGSSFGEDCDDFNADIYPDAPELCDGIDNDCDGVVDEDAVDAPAWSVDADGDGFGDTSIAVYSCDAVEGMIADATDCDDTDPLVNPTATERFYDGIDGDCDGQSDFDADRDGYDSDQYGGDDCNDADPAISPGATETWYDGVDGDCDGESDNDSDLDGYDSDQYRGDDCDDTDPTIHPGAQETWYDGIDGDCDGASDNDADQDGHDARAQGGDDCNDGDDGVNPDASEVCDGTDNNCDGTVDEDTALDAPTWYTDGDGDGYGDPDLARRACEQPAGTVANASDCDDTDARANLDDLDADGWSTCDGDCDDSTAGTNPGADDLPDDGIDNDCDGEVDNYAETWVVTTESDFLLGGLDGHGTITSHDDGELQLAWLATGFSTSSATSSLPSAMSSMGVVAANGFLYQVGGSITSGYSSSYITEVASAAVNADGSLAAWDNSLEQIPTGTSTHALVTDGHCLVVVGGVTSSDSTAEEVYTAELYGDGTIAPWVAQASLSSGRGHADAALVQGFVYVIGGASSSTYSAAVYVAQLGPDCSIDAWSSTTDLPSGRQDHAVTTAGDHIYVVGGQSTSGASSRVYMATPATDGTISAWSTENSLPDNLYALGAVASNGYLIAGGGYDGSSSQDALYYAAIAADGSLGVWGTASTSLSGDRRYYRLVSWDDNLYQVGGRSDSSSYYATRSSTVQQFPFGVSTSLSALQTGFSYVFDLGANLELVSLDWAFTAMSDGDLDTWYRLTSDGGTPGSWTAASSTPTTLAGTARYVELWMALTSASGDGSTLDEIILSYRE